MYNTRELKRKAGAHTQQKTKKSSASKPAPDNATGTAGFAAATASTMDNTGLNNAFTPDHTAGTAGVVATAVPAMENTLLADNTVGSAVIDAGSVPVMDKTLPDLPPLTQRLWKQRSCQVDGPRP